MSEKTDLELQVDPSMHKAALQRNDANSQPAKKKNTFRSRLWKAFYIIECHFMAGILHGYIIAHAQKAHLARWDEVMIPDVENLVDWIKLFISSSTERRFPWMSSTAFFWIAAVNFAFYAWWYFDCNKRTDRFQSWTLASVVAVGFVVAMVLGFGLWISTFCVVPRAVVVGLLASDFAHLVFPRLQRRTEDGPNIEVRGVVPEKA